MFRWFFIIILNPLLCFTNINYTIRSILQCNFLFSNFFFKLSILFSTSPKKLYMFPPIFNHTRFKTLFYFLTCFLLRIFFDKSCTNYYSWLQLAFSDVSLRKNHVLFYFRDSNLVFLMCLLEKIMCQFVFMISTCFFWYVS